MCHRLWHNGLLKHPDFYVNSKSVGSCLGWHTGKGPLKVTVEHGGAVAFADPLSIEVVHDVQITELRKSQGKPGDRISIIGSGFSKTLIDNSVTFTAETGELLQANVLRASVSELSVIVPVGTGTGPVKVDVDGEESNSVSFQLLSASVAIRFGDNGSANDDTYGLYVDGQSVYSMTNPSRSVGPFSLQLAPGQHTATLRGIDAPDGIGTYFIEFAGVTNLSGDSPSGDDLVNGVEKRWTFTVDGTSTLSTSSMSQPRELIWQE